MRLDAPDIDGDQLRAAAPYAAGALAVLAWVAAVVFGPTLLVLIYSVVFAAAFAFVPLLAYVVGRSMPRFIAEPVAALLVSVGLGGIGRAWVEYRDGEYVKRLPDDAADVSDGDYFRVGLGKVAFVYDRGNGDLEAWTEDVDTETLGGLDKTELQDGKVDAATHRNGIREFIDTKAPDGSLFVRAAEALQVWQDSASIEDAHIGENKARHEQNKEASTTDRTFGDRVEWFVLFAVGVGIGYVFFF